MKGKAGKYKRLSWDEYFLGIVDAVGARATCDMSGAGCLITKDNKIISSGYTGSASGLPHCFEVGHQLENGICKRIIHAEHNALSQAIRSLIPLEGATMYSSKEPCKACKDMAHKMGIIKIIIK